MLDNNKKLQAIAEISLLANKWAMWIDTCLPERKTFVPPVYQTRDAYYHLIRAVSQGLEQNGPLESEDSRVIGQFWGCSEVVSKQLTEVQHHASRAFFDTVDYAFYALQEKRLPASNFRISILLESSLKKRINAIHKLRELKSETEEEIIETVRKWDFVLTSVVSAYTLVEEFDRLDKHIAYIQKLLVDVEVRYDPETLDKASGSFDQLRKRVVEISSEVSLDDRFNAIQTVLDRISTDSHYKLTSDDMDSIECLFDEANKLCANREQELEDIAYNLKTLGGTLYSTQVLRNARTKISKLSQITGVTTELLITAIPTYLIENHLFPDFTKEVSVENFDLSSLVEPRVLSFLLIYLVMLFFVHQIVKHTLMGFSKLRIYRHYRKLKKEMNHPTNIGNRWRKLEKNSQLRIESCESEHQGTESHKFDA